MSKRFELSDNRDAEGGIYAIVHDYIPTEVDDETARNQPAAGKKSLIRITITMVPGVPFV